MSRAQELVDRLVANGEAAIDQFIADRASEELFLDFKRSADDGAGVRLHQTDRNNLSKAISGFGNSEGGVILWGVDCRTLPATGDVAQAKFPLTNPTRFVSWLEGATSGATIPAHPHVRSLPIPSAVAGTGFVVTLIKASHLAPHQAIPDLTYHMRAGSDFVRVPHAVLQGMFGQRPQAQVFYMWGIRTPELIPLAQQPTRALSLRVNLLLSSYGPGIARDLFFTGGIVAPGGPTTVRIGLQDGQRWEGHVTNGTRVSVVLKDGFKLAPEAILEPVFADIRLEPPCTGRLSYAFNYGHGQSPVSRIEHTVLGPDLDQAFQEYMATRNTGALYSRVFGVTPTTGDA